MMTEKRAAYSPLTGEVLTEGWKEKVGVETPAAPTVPRTLDLKVGVLV